jgi:hypothetical protein
MPGRPVKYCDSRAEARIIRAVKKSREEIWQGKADGLLKSHAPKTG